MSLPIWKKKLQSPPIKFTISACIVKFFSRFELILLPYLTFALPRLSPRLAPPRLASRCLSYPYHNLNLPVSFTGDDFQCPVCRGRGDDPKADCDKKIKFESCNRANAICESTLYTYGTFTRQCSDTYTYQTSLGYCEKMNNCKKVMCRESRCKAEFPLGK